MIKRLLNLLKPKSSPPAPVQVTPHQQREYSDNQRPVDKMPHQETGTINRDDLQNIRPGNTSPSAANDGYGDTHDQHPAMTVVEFIYRRFETVL